MINYERVRTLGRQLQRMEDLVELIVGTAIGALFSLGGALAMSRDADALSRALDLFFVVVGVVLVRYGVKQIRAWFKGRRR